MNALKMNSLKSQHHRKSEHKTHKGQLPIGAVVTQRTEVTREGVHEITAIQYKDGSTEERKSFATHPENRAAPVPVGPLNNFHDRMQSKFGDLSLASGRSSGHQRPSTSSHKHPGMLLDANFGSRHRASTTATKTERKAPKSNKPSIHFATKNVEIPHDPQHADKARYDAHKKSEHQSGMSPDGKDRHTHSSSSKRESSHHTSSRKPSSSSAGIKSSSRPRGETYTSSTIYSSTTRFASPPTPSSHSSKPSGTSSRKPEPTSQPHRSKPSNAPPASSKSAPKVPNYYEILSLTPGATAEEIKTAYKRESLIHHPDRNIGDESATAKFQAVNEAYEILGDELKKAAYDRKVKGL